MSGASLTIDLAALAHNLGVIRAAAPGAEVAPVVKADGYGLGAGRVCERLWDEGARTFFVARLSEGEALRAAMGAREAEIVVLDGLTEGSAARMAAANLTPALTTLDQIDVWGALSAGRRLPCVLHFDTGMNRLGIAVSEAGEAAARTAQLAGLDLRMVMSHLSFATTPGHPRNAEQLARFRQILQHFPGVRASLSASAGAFLGPDYRFDVIRPGISLFGGGPEERPHADLQPVASLYAPILQIRDLSAGDSVGYGSMFQAAGPMRVAIVEAGYADGLLRTSFAKGKAAVHGALRPLVIVSMDLIGVDVTGIDDLAVGDPVELLGPTVMLDDVAAAAGTVAHECLVRLSPRAERIYRG